MKLMGFFFPSRSSVTQMVRLCTIFLALCVPAAAQQPKKIPRIGYLSLRSGAGDIDLAFRQGLRDLGYIEGQNVIIEWRFAEGKSERYPLLAAELVHIGVDAIVTIAATTQSLPP